MMLLLHPFQYHISKNLQKIKTKLVEITLY